MRSGISSLPRCIPFGHATHQGSLRPASFRRFAYHTIRADRIGFPPGRPESIAPPIWVSCPIAGDPETWLQLRSARFSAHGCANSERTLRRLRLLLTRDGALRYERWPARSVPDRAPGERQIWRGEKLTFRRTAGVLAGTTFPAVQLPSMIHQNMPHQLCRDSEEMGSVLPV